MPTRQEKANLRAQCHFKSVKAHDSKLPHTVKSTVAQPELSKSIIAKHRAMQEKILSKPNEIYRTTDPNIKCNQIDCFTKSKCTLLKKSLH